MVFVGRSARKRGEHSLRADYKGPTSRHVDDRSQFADQMASAPLPLGRDGQATGHPVPRETMTGAAARVVLRQGQDDAPEGDGAALALSPPGVLVTSPFPYMLKTGNGAAPVQSLVVGGNPPGTSGRGTRTPSALERQLALERRTPASSNAKSRRDFVLSPLPDGNGGTHSPAALGHAKGTPTGALEQYRTPQATAPKSGGQSTCQSAKVSPDAASSPVDGLVINYRDGRDPSPDGSALSARSRARLADAASPLGNLAMQRPSPLLARRLAASSPCSAKLTPRSASGSGSRGTIRSRRSPVSSSSGSLRRPDPPGTCSPVEQRLEQQRLDALVDEMEQLKQQYSELVRKHSELSNQQGQMGIGLVEEMLSLEQELAGVKTQALETSARLNAQAGTLAAVNKRYVDLTVEQKAQGRRLSGQHERLSRLSREQTKLRLAHGEKRNIVDDLCEIVGEHSTQLVALGENVANNAQRLAGAEGRLEAAEGRLKAVEGDVEALKAEITRQLQVYRRQMQVGQVEMVKSKPGLMAKACDFIKSLMDRFSDGGRRIIPFDLSHMTEIAGMLNAQVQSSEPFGKKSRQRTTLNKLELWDLYETKFSPDIERGPFHKADDMAIIQAWNEKKSAREIGATVLPASGRGARDLRQMDSRIEWLKANAEKKYGEKMLSKKKS
ncbi:hypothetical protein ACHAXT_000078 [Thalassiosira profunda]